MSATPDPGYRDLDASPAFEAIVANLEHWNTTPYVQRARRILYRLMRPHPGVRLLDAGGATGFDAAALASRVLPGGCVVSLDLSERMTLLAKQRHGHLEGIEFRTASVLATGLPDASFDASWTMRTLQYLDDPLAAVIELVRVTRPGGRVIVVEGGMSAVDLPDGELTRQIFGPRPGLGMRLPNLLRAAGLQRVAVHPAFGRRCGHARPKCHRVRAVARRSSRRGGRRHAGRSAGMAQDAGQRHRETDLVL